MKDIIFHADHHFMIGDGHRRDGKPCQDHALSEIRGSYALATVSDGCSGGGQTDIGARLVSLATANAVAEERDDTPDGKTAERVRARRGVILRHAQDLLRLDTADMLATSIYTLIGTEGGYVSVHGDGIVAYRLRDGILVAHRFEWADNTPFYPAYRNGALDSFVGAHGADLEAKRLTEHGFVRNTEGRWSEFHTKEYSLREGIDGIVIPFDRMEIEDIETIAVMTDGLTQVGATDWKDVVASFLDFRNHTGMFVKRRMEREMIARQKRGEVPYDDLAMAVIHVGMTEMEIEND